MRTLLLLLLAAPCCAANLGDADLRVRSLYVQEVRNCIPSVVKQLRSEGYPQDAVAKAAHQLRREIGQEYKSLSSHEAQLEIRHRNLMKYGDPLGPTVAYLRAKGLSWYDITSGASRVGGTDILPPGTRLPCLGGYP